MSARDLCILLVLTLALAAAPAVATVVEPRGCPVPEDTARETPDVEHEGAPVPDKDNGTEAPTRLAGPTFLRSEAQTLRHADPDLPEALPLIPSGESRSHTTRARPALKAPVIRPRLPRADLCAGLTDLPPPDTALASRR